MGTLDWIFCAFFVFAAMHGLWRGLIKEVLDLAAWVIGFFAAQMFAAQIGVHLPVTGASPEMRYLMGFVLVLILCLILVSMVSELLSNLISAVGLGFLNSLMGSVFALSKVMVLCLCLTTIVRLTPVKEFDVWQQSMIAEYLVVVLNNLKPLLPQEFGKYVI
ncbi:MAG: CvpA family protein [Burkholderiaceae bacterium]